jgi:hypothetical protein
LEDVGVGVVADGDEAAVQRDVFGVPSCVLLMRMPVTPLWSPSTSSRGVGLELDLAFGDLLHQLVDQDGLGLELVAAVHRVTLLAMLDRYSASSTAVLPPPITHTGCSR